MGLRVASVRQRPNGSWRARYRDADGNEHARHFALKRDAQRWLDEVTASVVTGRYVDPRAGTALWDNWTTDWVARQAWAAGTVSAAETALHSVSWRQKGMGDVKPSHVQAWISSETKRGIAASTMRTRLNYVQMAFRAAVLDKVIAESPAAAVKPPRVRRADVAMEILTLEQSAAVLATAGRFRPFVEVCLFAGLRLGEAAGLRLGDVNFLGRAIDVRRQVQGSSIASTDVVPPKYGSERTVFVPADLTASLSAHVAAHSIDAPDAYLFRTPTGHLFQRNNAGEEWRGIRSRAHLPSTMTLHTLRHTFASNLIASGCDVVTVQRALGHAQPSITLNTYAHLWPSAEDKTRAATADLMASIAALADSPRTQGKKSQVRA